MNMPLQYCFCLYMFSRKQNHAKLKKKKTTVLKGSFRLTFFFSIQHCLLKSIMLYAPLIYFLFLSFFLSFFFFLSRSLSFFLSFFSFLGLYLWPTDIPRVELELQLPAYATGTVTRNLSHICRLCCNT